MTNNEVKEQLKKLFSESVANELWQQYSNNDEGLSFERWISKKFLSYIREANSSLLQGLNVLLGGY